MQITLRENRVSISTGSLNGAYRQLSHLTFGLQSAAKRKSMKTFTHVFVLSLVFGMAQPVQGQETKWRTISVEAISLYKKGEYDRAVVAVKKSLALAEKEYGPNHPDTATSLN